MAPPLDPDVLLAAAIFDRKDWKIEKLKTAMVRAYLLNVTRRYIYSIWLVDHIQRDMIGLVILRPMIRRV